MRFNLAQADITSLVSTITRFVSLESPSGGTELLAQAASVLETAAKESGLITNREQAAQGDHLIWTLPAREAAGTILFISHYDTVWPSGTLASMPVHIDGDRLCGPGVYDTKAGLAILLDVLRRIQKSGRAHPEVRVVVVADEEVGSPTATGLISREAETADVVFGLEPPHPDGSLKTARRGSTRARITVRGVESHAALDPAAGVNAIDELIDQLSTIKTVVSERPVLLNVGTISGGGRTNVVAGTAYADLGFRFSSAEDEAAVLAALKSLQPQRERASVHSELLSHRPTWVESESTRRLCDVCSRIAEDIGQPLDGFAADGAADTNTTGALGHTTVDGLAPRGGGAHASHEWVSLDSIRERAELLPELILGVLPAINAH